MVCVVYPLITQTAQNYSPMWARAVRTDLVCFQADVVKCGHKPGFSFDVILCYRLFWLIGASLVLLLFDLVSLIC